MLGLAACAPPTPAQGGGDTRLIADGKGREVAVPVSVTRIVCVGVGALRYTCYMQAQDLVIGVEDYEKEATVDRLYNLVNFERFSTLPAIGGNGEPWHEAIIAVNPQLIVLSELAGVDADELQQRYRLQACCYAYAVLTLELARHVELVFVRPEVDMQEISYAFNSTDLESLAVEILNL